MMLEGIAAKSIFCYYYANNMPQARYEKRENPRKEISKILYFRLIYLVCSDINEFILYFDILFLSFLKSF
jgi:hypothetical protein